MATRFLPFRTRRDLTVCGCSAWWFGHKPSQLAKCFSVGNLLTSDADLTQDHQRRRHLDPLDGRQIHAHGPEQRMGAVEPQVVGLAAALSRLALRLGTGPDRSGSLASACSIRWSHSVTFIW